MSALPQVTYLEAWGIFQERAELTWDLWGLQRAPDTKAGKAGGLRCWRALIKVFLLWGTFKNLIKTTDRLPEVTEYTHSHAHPKECFPGRLCVRPLAAAWYKWLLPPGAEGEGMRNP